MLREDSKIKKLLSEIDRALGPKTLKSFNVSVKQSKIKKIGRAVKKSFKESKKLPSASKVRKYAKKKGIKLSYKEAKNIAETSNSIKDAEKFVRGIKKKQQVQNLNQTIEHKKKYFDKLKNKGIEADAKKVAKEIKSLEIQKKNIQLREYQNQLKKAEEAGNVQKSAELSKKIKDVQQKRLNIKDASAETVAGWSTDKAPTSIENWILDNYRKELNELKMKGKSYDEAIDYLVKKALKDGKLKEGKHKKPNGHYGLIDESGDVHSPR